MPSLSVPGLEAISTAAQTTSDGFAGCMRDDRGDALNTGGMVSPSVRSVPGPIGSAASRAPGERHMRLSASVATIFCVVVGHSPAQAGIDEAPEAYQIAVATAVPVLPPPLQDFFEAHLETFRQRATAGLERTSTSTTFPGKPDWHYVMLDVAADVDTPAARHAAARAFPHDHKDAVALFKKHGRRSGGSLPWVIKDRYGAMVEAFRDGKVDVIVQEAGVLLHFTTDAALPFNTTADRDGATTGHLRWSAASGASHGILTFSTVRHRLQPGLIHRLRERLEYEVRVAPDRYGPIGNPVDAAFDVLLDAHRALETLLNLDAEAIADLDITDAKGFAASSDAYYDRVADRAGAVIESQLEAGALLGAKLIGAAWVEAGSPAPGAWDAPAVTDAPPVSAAEAPTARFVGSRHSTVFHRVTCSHAERIKPTNRVHFKTVREAITAGRTPCKTCRPENP